MRGFKGIVSIALAFSMCLAAGCNTPKQVAAAIGTKTLTETQVDINNAADVKTAVDSKLDSYGSVYDGKRGQTYGSDTPLHNAESGISNAPIAGNGSIGLTLGGSAVGQSMNIGMNDFWDGKYSESLGEGDGVLPLTLGSVGYNVVDETSTAVTDIDIAPQAKTVTASSTRSNDFSPWAAVAGDYVSVAYWGFGWWTANNQGSNSWIQLEFDTEISFQRFALWNVSTCRNGAGVNRATGVSEWNTNTYEVQVSNTGAAGSWSTVFREEENRQPICDRDLSAVATGKFVRLFIEKPVSGSHDKIARVNKFSLYASPKNDKNLMPKLVNGINSEIKVNGASFSGDANSAGTDIYATVSGYSHNLAGWGQMGYGWFTSGNPSDAYVTYKLNAAASFKSYQLFNGSASAANSYGRRDWLGWQLQTSADGVNFDTVHEVFPPSLSSAENAGGQPSVSSFDLSTEAVGVNYIRLKCTKAAGGQALMSQLKIFADTLQNSGVQTGNRAAFHQNIRVGNIGADCTYNGLKYSADTSIGQSGKNYIVTEFTNKSNEDITFRYYTFAHRYRLPDYTQNAGISDDGRTIYSTRTTRTDFTTAWIGAATIAATIEGGTWKNTAKSVGTAYGDFTVSANSVARIITCVDGRQYNGSNRPEGYASLKSIVARNTPTQALAITNSKSGVGTDIIADCEAFWTDFWSKSFVDVSDEIVEKYYYNALYIVGSATREDNVPASLFGPFTTSDTMAWGGAYTTDYNLYGTYMALAGSNRADLLKPLVRNALESWGGTDLGGGIGKDYGMQLNSLNHLGPFKDKNGNLIFKNGVDGILSAVVSGPHGYAVNQAGFFYVMFTSAYAAVPVLAYYDMTQGKGELAPGVTLTKQMEYDYLKDMMLLWEQILYYEDGQYKVRHDGAWEFEQIGGAVDPAAHTTSNAFTIAAMHKFTRRLIDGAKELGITAEDEPRLTKWADINANIEPLPTTNARGSDGKVRLAYSDTKESANKGNVTYSSNQNPNVVVAQVFPMGDLGLYSSNKEKQIMRNTLATMQAWKNMNAMPTIFSVAARVGYAEASDVNDIWFAKENGQPIPNLLMQMRQVAQSGMANNNISNLIDPLELIDQCGGAQGVNDMLVQKHKNIITLFPAFPKNSDGKFANLQVNGGYLVSAAYNGTSRTVSDVKIESKYGGKIALALPKGVRWKIVDENGATVQSVLTTAAAFIGIDEHTEVAVLSFATEKNHSYFAVPV